MFQSLNPLILKGLPTAKNQYTYKYCAYYVFGNFRANCRDLFQLKNELLPGSFHSKGLQMTVIYISAEPYKQDPILRISPVPLPIDSSDGDELDKAESRAEGAMLSGALTIRLALATVKASALVKPAPTYWQFCRTTGNLIELPTETRKRARKS